MSAIAQVIVTVQGQVQGVGYRAACVDRARLLGLRGWVRNRSDGAVEAYLAGPEVNVLRMREWMWEGPVSAQVAHLVVAPGEQEAVPPGFEIRATV